MLELLDARYADGVTGYCEAVQATVCNATSWCTFGNFSQAHVSPLFGFSGGLATSLQTMREFGKLYPHHFFHPVRAPPPKENKGAKILGGESEHYDVPLPRASSEELLRTLCRLANPPPIAWGRFEAPIGLPNHRQRMCDMKAHYECLWDHPTLTMTLGGANACLSTCRKTQGKHCPLACVVAARARKRDANALASSSLREPLQQQRSRGVCVCRRYEQIKETQVACERSPATCALRDADALMDGLRRSEHASEEYRAGEFGTAAAAFRAHIADMKTQIFEKSFSER